MRGFGQFRTLFDQLVAAAAQGIVDRSRNGEYLPAAIVGRSRAVISEPLRRAASTTKVPRLKPAMMRLRCGKLRASRGEFPEGTR